LQFSGNHVYSPHANELISLSVVEIQVYVKYAGRMTTMTGLVATDVVNSSMPAALGLTLQKLFWNIFIVNLIHNLTNYNPINCI
jgi:hypothetical protein